MDEKTINQFIFNPKEGQTILMPEGKGKGFWIGAPTIIFDEKLDKYFLYVRIRNPRPKNGKVKPNDTYRGYKCQIYESIDGVNFNLIWEMKKQEIGARSIEQAALIKISKRYHMFLSYESTGIIPRWKIVRQVVDHPSKFSAYKFKELDWNIPFFCRFSIKDPIIKKFNNRYYLFIDYVRLKKPWTSTAVLISDNGERFNWYGDIFINAKECKWARFLMRLTSVLQVDGKFLGFFDGTSKYKDICDEKSGICFGNSPKKLDIWSLEKPSYQSEYGKGSVRYLYALKNRETILIYYEYTETNGEHVLKMKSF